MNIRPYMPGFYQPSPNVDIDRPRLTLQMSLPQMSEIPNEERVQYAYQKQVELQKKINGHTNNARQAPDAEDDEIIKNTPTAGSKPGGNLTAGQDPNPENVRNPSTQSRGILKTGN